MRIEVYYKSSLELCQMTKLKITLVICQANQKTKDDHCQINIKYQTKEKARLASNLKERVERLPNTPPAP